METKKNLLEIQNDIVHADGAIDDHTLCGVTTEITIDRIEKYDPERETETEPTMLKTNRKINCETCLAIIKHCVEIWKSQRRKLK